MKGENLEKFKEYYQKKRVTGTYDLQREGTNYRKKKREKELRIFLEFLGKKPGEKILELGCSSGFLTKHLGKVTAIDTSKEMFEIAKKKNPKAKYIHADMFKLPFKKNSFDKVVTMRVWTHLTEKEIRKAIKEAKRVLKKGGALVFDLEDKSLLRRIAGFFYVKIFNITGFKVYQYSLKDISRILSSEGFKLEKAGYFSHRIGRQMVLRARKAS